MHQAQVQHHTWYCFTSCGTDIRLDICDKNIKKAIKKFKLLYYHSCKMATRFALSDFAYT